MVCADRLAVRAMRRFSDEYRGKSREERSKVPCLKSKVNEKWRRIANMPEHQEPLMDARERRAGIGALVGWIREFTKGDCRVTIAGRGGITAGGSRGLDAVGVPLVAAQPGPLGRATLDEDGATLSRADAREAEDVWVCEGQAREVVVRVCAELNISRHKLSELTREYRGINATELIDGFRVGKIKSALAERVKRFARELWLSPGNYVGVLVCDKRLKLYGGGKSDYFVDPSEDFYRRGLAETREERMGALITAFDAGWREGGSSREGFAAVCGFRTFSELNRACLNVWGVSARQVANDICGDVIDYYLAREEEELREMACCGRVTPGVARARYLYCGGSGAPVGDAARVSLLWERLGVEFRERMKGWLDTA